MTEATFVVTITDQEAVDHGLRIGHVPSLGESFAYLRERFREEHGVDLPDDLEDPRITWELDADLAATRITYRPDAPTEPEPAPTPTDHGRPVPACCGFPLISTLVFSGAELYCAKCGGRYGIFAYPERVALTPALAATKAELEARFLQISAACIPRGSGRRDCERCQAGEYHSSHASDEELEASTRAYAVLRDGIAPNLPEGARA